MAHRTTKMLELFMIYAHSGPSLGDSLPKTRDLMFQYTHSHVHSLRVVFAHSHEHLLYVVEEVLWAAFKERNQLRQPPNQCRRRQPKTALFPHAQQDIRRILRALHFDQKIERAREILLRPRRAHFNGRQQILHILDGIVFGIPSVSTSSLSHAAFSSLTQQSADLPVTKRGERKMDLGIFPTHCAHVDSSVLMLLRHFECRLIFLICLAGTLAVCAS
mmetsp:Transcript_89907/g.131605  ORF Transcript_89907/g.131605 Transcript_89907/m.131605 type:complete len:218 (+) Transcript_89907:1996-2649(+)